ncbi:hypothetical protein PspLS_02214, partial [Pyricularia sp. CBS 133598]
RHSTSKRSLACHFHWVGTAFPERTPLLPQGISADLPANLRAHSASNHQSGPLNPAQFSPTQGDSCCQKTRHLFTIRHSTVLSCTLTCRPYTVLRLHSSSAPQIFFNPGPVKNTARASGLIKLQLLQLILFRCLFYF